MTHELHAKLRRAPLRVAWVDMWQLQERQLCVASVDMSAGMNRRVRDRPAHTQQGRFELLDRMGQVRCGPSPNPFVRAAPSSAGARHEVAAECRRRPWRT